MSNVEQMKPEISVRILRCALVYYEQSFGREALSRVINDTGALTLEYLENESNWVAFTYLEDILERMTEASGDPQFPYHAGLYQSSPEVMPVARTFVRALGSPGLMFDMVFGDRGQMPLVNRAGRFRVEEISSSSVQMTYRPISAAYRERNNNLHEFRRGQIASLTRLFGLPVARCVEHEVVGEREGSRYTFVWADNSNARRAPWGRRGLLIGAAVGALMAATAVMTAKGWVVASTFVLLCAAVGFVIGRLAEDSEELQTKEERVEAIQRRNQEMQEALLAQNALTEAKNDELFETNQELELANAELKRNYAELEALNATLEERVAERTRRLQATAEELKASNRKLQDADALKDAFFATINHELRTPLTLIITPLENLLSNPSDLNVDQISLLRTMLANSRRLLKLINDLLDLSRFEAERVRLRYEEVEIVPGVQAVVDRFMPSARDARLNVDLKLAEDTGAVWMDRDRFEQILNNLLSNAFKFTPSGGTISVSTSRDASWVQLVVSDTGQGIPLDLQANLFDRFSVGGSRAVRGYGGSGLGLSLVKEIIDLHQGELELKSQEGQGARFTVRLPVGREHVRAELMDRRRPAGASAEDAPLRREDDQLPARMREKLASDLTALQISDIAEHRGLSTVVAPPHVPGRELLLLVDDHPELLQMLIGMLGSHYNLMIASDGEEALQIALENLPDLVLSDVVMPRKDGFELCADLKADPRTSHIPIILLSAKTGEGKLDQGEFRGIGIEQGANDFLNKPFSARELFARVASQLKLRRMEGDLRRRNDQLNEMNAQLTEMATTDHLTGLLNRREFERRLTEQFDRARSSTRDMAVVMFDVDHFRRINNTYGHPDGDKVLSEVARDTMACTQVHGFAGRYGGEEFILCFPGWSQDRATSWAEELRRRVAARCYLPEHPDEQVTISIGVAGFPEHHVESHEALVKLADDALYLAKERGRDRVVASIRPS